MDFNDNKPIYSQIANYIASKILKKEYKAGERIPSIRELSIKLCVNNGTVVKGFELLEQEGIIANQRGKGFFVTDLAKEKIHDLFKQEFFDKELPELIKKMKILNISVEEIILEINKY